MSLAATLDAVIIALLFLCVALLVLVAFLAYASRELARIARDRRRL